MAGLSNILVMHPPPIIQIQPISTPFSPPPHINCPSFSIGLTLTTTQNNLKKKKPKRFGIRAKNGGGDGGSKDVREEERRSGGDDEELKKDGRRPPDPVFNLKWGDLLDPDPDNLFAVALTGLLAWASVQVLGQLVFISLAILVAALKYSFIAALLIFILITLL